MENFYYKDVLEQNNTQFTQKPGISQNFNLISIFFTKSIWGQFHLKNEKIDSFIAFTKFNKTYCICF
jgi:hypothetical protein